MHNLQIKEKIKVFAKKTTRILNLFYFLDKSLRIFTKKTTTNWAVIIVYNNYFGPGPFKMNFDETCSEKSCKFSRLKTLQKITRFMVDFPLY